MLRSSFDAALGILNTETIGLAKQGFLMWEDHVNATRAPDEPKVKVHFAVLTFNQIQDRQTRDRFHAMPTTFRLSQVQVDDLIAQSRDLLQSSPEFTGFRQRIEAQASEQQ